MFWLCVFWLPLELMALGNGFTEWNLYFRWSLNKRRLNHIRWTIFYFHFYCSSDFSFPSRPLPAESEFCGWGGNSLKNLDQFSSSSPTHIPDKGRVVLLPIREGWWFRGGEIFLRPPLFSLLTIQLFNPSPANLLLAFSPRTPALPISSHTFLLDPLFFCGRRQGKRHLGRWWQEDRWSRSSNL